MSVFRSCRWEKLEIWVLKQAKYVFSGERLKWC